MDVHAYMAERAPLVDAVLERVLPDPEAGNADAPTALQAAMRQLVFPAGKRIRPVLAMAAAEAVGARPELALPMAAAVELIHTYSLVHDDLPCMDDDDLRRGRPTVHVIHGDALAVLAGDALQSLAFEVLSSEGEASSSVLAVRDLARAIGAAGLVGGQVDDLAFVAGDSEAAIMSIHERKTAALIEAAIVGGARLAGAGPDVLERLSAFGFSIGVAFQIADDLLDAEDDDGCTLIGVLDIETCRGRAEALLADALALLESFGERAEPLRELARYAVRRRL
jgi:geranylgeranyl diphosphate synthase type II